MSQSGIYAIENTANGHLYVGSAVDFMARRRVHLHHLRHRKHHSPPLQRAFNKYGEEAFVFKLLEEVPRDRDLLFERETRWVQMLHPRYNANPVHATRLGMPVSEATRQKLRAYANRPEVIAARRAARLGKPRSSEVIEKIRRSLTGKKVSEKARQALAQGSINRTFEQRRPMLGKKLSDATRALMSDAVTEEMCQQRSETSKALWANRSEEERQLIVDTAHSKEATRKRIESMKAVWQDEEYRSAVSEKIRETWQDEELRLEQSETMKAMWATRSEEERRAYIEPTLTEEARQNRAKASKSMWNDRSEEERQRILAATRSEEALRKRSESMKAMWQRKKAAKEVSTQQD